MKRYVTAIAALLLAGSQSLATQLFPDTSQRTAQLRDGAFRLAPIGAVIFCSTYPQQCTPNPASAPPWIALTPAVWKAITSVNAAINRRITPNRSKGTADWSLETAHGNCNDYAVQKRKALHDRGMPLSVLLLSLVTTADGKGHLVLTVRTDRGDFILDNLRDAVRPPLETGYRWLMRQSSSDPKEWVAIREL